MGQRAHVLVPVDNTYLIALGQAIYCFAALERIAVSCVQKIGEKGYSPKTSRHYADTVPAKTAEQIAREFMAAAEGITHSELRVAVQPAADQFRALTKRRNDLLHADAGAASNGDRRLYCKGREWTIPDLEDLADKFVRCSSTLNHIYNMVL